jgi:translocation and assembly module TamA
MCDSFLFSFGFFFQGCPKRTRIIRPFSRGGVFLQKAFLFFFFTFAGQTDLYATKPWPQNGETHTSEALSETEDDPFENTSTVRPVPYQVLLEIKDHNGKAEFVKEFFLQSELLRNKKNGAVSLEQLKEVTKNDKQLLIALCEKAGYFDAHVSYRIQLDAKKGFLVTFRIKLNRLYTIKKIIIQGHNCKTYFSFLQKYIKPGEPFHFSTISLAKEGLINAIRAEGSIFSQVSAPLLDLDRESQSVTVTFPCEKSDHAYVSSVRTTGNQKVPSSFILNRVVQPHTPLFPFHLANSRQDLLETGLFSEVEILAVPDFESKGPQLSPSSALPKNWKKALIIADVVEAPPRMLGIGAYFSLSEGFLVSGTWQNKNFCNKADHLGAVVRMGTKERSATAFWGLSDVFARYQTLHSELSLKNIATKAYQGNKFCLGIGWLQNGYIKKTKASFSLSPAWEYGQLERKNKYKQGFVSLGTEVTLNMTNHRLYPTSGSIFSVGFYPYFGKFSKVKELSQATPPIRQNQQIVTNTEEASLLSEDDFSPKAHVLTQFKGSFRGYLPLSSQMDTPENSTVLAMFSSFGTTFQDQAYLPLDKRFYGGGRSSIRSYGHQMCSNLDENDRPMGSASFFEICVEPRLRLSKNIGAVAFLELSCSSASKMPTFSENDCFLWGGGLGVRYFTSFGPIRIDIAFPFKRRLNQKTNQKIDKPFQIYISVGHSF